MALRRFRFYRTAHNKTVVKDELRALGFTAAAAVAEAMKRYERDESLGREVKSLGTRVRNHLLYELRVTLDGNEYRVIFAPVTRGGHVVLALTAFSKKQRQIAAADLDRAKSRLQDWLARGEPV